MASDPGNVSVRLVSIRGRLEGLSGSLRNIDARLDPQPSAPDECVPVEKAPPSIFQLLSDIESLCTEACNVSDRIAVALGV